MLTEARERLLSARGGIVAPASPRPRFVDPDRLTGGDVEFEAEAAIRRMVRAEADLVRRFRAWLDPQDARLRGVVIPVGREHLRVDLYDTELDLLIEAKGAATRNCMRQAVGQLVDYRRYLSPRPRLAILLPVRPSDDLFELPNDVGIAIIWAAGHGFSDSLGGELTTRTTTRRR